MIVDDRLDTVLQTQTAGRAGLNTQFRQLVDLLARTPDSHWTEQHARALDRVDALFAQLGDARAAVLTGLCTLRSPRLVAHLAHLGPRTAVAAIGRAHLADAAWLALVPRLPIQARGALRHRRDLAAPVRALLERLGIDDFVLEGPPGETAAPAAPPVLVAVPTPASPRAEPAAPGREGIGAIVRRIEAFRRNRQQDLRADPGQARLPFAEDGSGDPAVLAIDIAIDAAGMICAADGVDPALLVGHVPFAPVGAATAAQVDPPSAQAFAARQPIVAGRLVIAGAPRVAGVWRIDGAPRFGADGGQFTGYRARLRRPAHAAADPAGHAAPDRAGADKLQQLLHELRTPINAIQGFAELIQQQLLGPTPHQYRSHAAAIAADAARMLAGFEDVERLVRLETGRAQIEPGTADLAAIMAQLMTRLEPLVAPREIRLRWTVPEAPLPVAIDPVEAERLLWRLLATLTGAAAPGERLTLALAPDRHGTQAELAMTLPAALAQRDADALFAADHGRSGPALPGMLGHGFALRLVAAEARAGGGRLERPGPAGDAQLRLTLPLAAPATLDRDRAAL
jgi:signal transduction histidine kinase